VVRRKNATLVFARIHQELAGGMVDLTLLEPLRSRRKGGGGGGGETQTVANPWTSTTGSWTPCPAHTKAALLPGPQKLPRGNAQGRFRKIVPVWQVCVRELGESHLVCVLRCASLSWLRCASLSVHVR